jgi:DNA-directed RNA polymerase III subunit RPC5
MDPNDEVIRELDVYVTENDINLLLLQFPLRPARIDPPTLSTVNYKPQHKRMEMSIQYPSDIAVDREKYSSSDITDGQKLLSSTVKQSAFLAVGVIRDNNLHLTAVDDILQMRPSFHDMKFANEILEKVDDDDADIKTEADIKPMQQVSLKRKESEKAQLNRKQSYGYIHTVEENEAWLRLQHYDIGKILLTSKLAFAMSI